MRAISLIGAAALTVLAAAGCASSSRAPSSDGHGGITNAALARGDVERTYAEASEADRNRMVCRREVMVGSNRPQRICTTLAERDRMRANAQEAMQRANTRATICSDSAGCN